LDRGGDTLVAVLAALLILSVDRGEKTWWTRLLGAKPLAGLGRISYGFYLWHYPVAALATAKLNSAVGKSAAILVTALVTTGLAALSARFVERPIQRRCPDWARTASVLPTVAAPGLSS
jgi:peptidoglycan/LPS O-acetylase OafA/YrhL